MSSKRSDLGRSGYAGRGGSRKQGHPLGPGQHQKSLGAVRQGLGLPYFPAPPRGFRPEDEGKEVRDPRNQTIGPIDDMTPPRG